MIAKWNGQILAEAERSELLLIEGNWYFPPGSIAKEHFKDSDTHTTCPWKGEASYYDIVVAGEVNKDAAWYYPEPKAGSTERVKGDYSNFVAFWRGVEVSQ
jgi:uncharacterized protein (DUF427 family)